MKQVLNVSASFAYRPTVYIIYANMTIKSELNTGRLTSLMVTTHADSTCMHAYDWSYRLQSDCVTNKTGYNM